MDLRNSMPPENTEWMLVDNASDEDEGMSKPSSPISIDSDKTSSADDHMQAASYLETFGLVEPAAQGEALVDKSDTAGVANATAAPDALAAAGEEEQQQQTPSEATATIDSTFISKPLVGDRVASSHGSPAPKSTTGNHTQGGAAPQRGYNNRHTSDEINGIDLCFCAAVVGIIIASIIFACFVPYSSPPNLISTMDSCSKGVAASYPSTNLDNNSSGCEAKESVHVYMAPPPLLGDNDGSLASSRPGIDAGLDLEARLQRLELESLAATQRLNEHDIRLASLEAHLNDLEERLFGDGGERKHQRNDAKLKGDGQAQIDALTQVVLRGPSELAVAKKACSADNKENYKHPNFVMFGTEDNELAKEPTKGSRKEKNDKHKNKASKHHKEAVQITSDALTALSKRIEVLDSVLSTHTDDVELEIAMLADALVALQGRMRAFELKAAAEAGVVAEM